MEVLPAVPVALLFAVAVWLLWPAVADPIARLRSRRDVRSDADRIADSLFAAWSEQRDARELLAHPQRG